MADEDKVADIVNSFATYEVSVENVYNLEIFGFLISTAI